jgi:hypothetical protein
MKLMLQIHFKACTLKPLAEDHKKDKKKTDIFLLRRNKNQEMMMIIADQRKCETYQFSNFIEYLI